MARFTTAPLSPPAPPVGVHIARVTKARERISEAGNTVLLMTAQFPQGEQLGFAITFVEQAVKLIGYFCRSAELELPKEAGVEVEIKPADVEGRYSYPVVEYDGEGLEAVAKITRFLSRAEAITANSKLSEIKVQQTSRALKPISGGDRL